jgi:hypothetical protein
MKFSSSRAPLSPARARNCLLMNQFATPGLGSLMGRRFIAGAGQLLLAVVGFLLFCAWFVNVMTQYYALITRDIDPKLRPELALSGVGIFALGWCWAWVTSFSLLREARRNEREGKLISTGQVPPRL